MQHVAVGTWRTDGQRAPRAELGQEGPLDLDGGRVGGVVDARQQLGASASSAPALDRHAALTDRGHEPLGGRAARRPARSGRGPRARPRPSRSPRPRAPCPGGWRCCRAARRTSRSGRTAASWARRRTEPVATVAPGASSSRAGPISASAGSRRAHEGADRQRLVGTRRQVLGRVHGDVGAAVEDGVLDLLDEHALAADRVQRHVLAAVAGRLDEHELGRAVRSPRQRVGDGLGLGPRLRAARGWPGAARRHGGAQRRSNRSLTAAALRSPWGVPASWRRRTDGSCRSLATMARVSASTASRSASSRPASRPAKRASSRGADLLGPVVQLGDERRGLAGRDLDGNARPLRRRWRGPRSASPDRCASPDRPSRARSSRSSNGDAGELGDARGRRIGARRCRRSATGDRARCRVRRRARRDHALAGRRAGDDDVGTRRARRRRDRGRRPGHRPARRARRRAAGVRLHDDDLTGRRPGAVRWPRPRPSRRRRPRARCARPATPRRSAAISTAAWLIDAVPRPMAVSVRARLPTRTAWRKSRSSVERTPPSSWATCHAVRTWPRISLSPSTAESRPAATSKRCWAAASSCWL